MSRPLRALRITLGILCAALTFGSAPASAGISVFGIGDFRYSDFYVPPTPLPEGKPGDIIRAERMDFSKAITKPPTGTVGWKVMYLSTDALGKPMAVTGTILVRPDQVPAQGLARRPIVTYGNEAQGLGDNCAVSRLMTYGHTGELALITPLIRAGYAVVSTDFEGLGTPSTHTFGVTVSEAHAALDIVRAARQLPDAALPKNGPLAMFGYSIGGGAIGGAAELAATYSPELTFTAAAFGGAPMDLLGVSRNIDGGPAAAMNFVAAAAYDAAYPELNLDASLNAAGKALMPTVRESCIEIIPALAFQWLNNYTVRDFRNDATWKARFAENELGLRRIPFPTYYFHSTIDETAPYRQAVALRARYCGKRSPLRFSPIVGFDHIAAGPQWMPQAAKWLAARLQGKGDGGNCGQIAMPNSIG